MSSYAARIWCCWSWRVNRRRERAGTSKAMTAPTQAAESPSHASQTWSIPQGLANGRMLNRCVWWPACVSYVATRLILDVFCGLPSQLRARDDRQLAVELSVQPQPFIGLQPLCMATRDPPLDAQGSHIGVDVEPPHTFPDLMAANLACLTKAADVLSLLRSCSVRPLAPCLRAPHIHHTCSQWLRCVCGVGCLWRCMCPGV